jgi:hypothetical protein
MAAIGVLLGIATVGFASVIVITTMVVMGIRREEAGWSLARAQPPPTATARVARRVLGAGQSCESWMTERERSPESPLVRLGR